MNKLSVARRAEVVRCLDEGNSIRATVRPTGVAKNTISKLLLELGAACARFQNETLVNLTTKGVEADETWSFIGIAAVQDSWTQTRTGIWSRGTAQGCGTPALAALVEHSPR